jgi:hypothetical protein
MEQIYKSHCIVGSATLSTNTNQWRPCCGISWAKSNGGVQYVSLKNVPGTFGTREEAEGGAIIFARQWIDAGKRALLNPELLQG